MRSGAFAAVAAAFLALAASGLGCSKSEPEPAPAATASPASSSSASAASPMVLAPPGVRVTAAPAGNDAAQIIRSARALAQAEGRDLVVYVGATWCELCQYFHKAAAAGELDTAFPQLTLLEFDLDKDRERLATAGYVGDLIPLFALPDESGKASTRKLEGSIKGPGAVANLTPRLKKLLGK